MLQHAKKRLSKKSAPPPWYMLAALLSDVGAEVDGAPRDVYLVTISRMFVSPAQHGACADTTTLTSQQVGDAVRLALDDPVSAGGRGRPRARIEGVVEKVVSFRELHADGTPHFHVAVKLSKATRWARAKATLMERDHLPSHWSSTHTQFWSAVRYGYIPTGKKPMVDASPYMWTASGTDLNLFEESQRPYAADMWKQRREQAEKAAEAEPTFKKRRFCKLDLTSIIIRSELRTEAQVMEYVQRYGTDEMQIWTNGHQDQLPKIIKEAKAWAAAHDDATAEKESDWQLVCKTADVACPHGGAGQCRYAQASSSFFAGNQGVLDKEALAAALRAVIIGGPSKVTRVPLIVGPTNTAKSTLVLPFDQLYGKSKVFHKPAMRSSFPLANIRKGKRFLFWDDYRPVDYAQGAVPVTTYLSLFQGAPFEVALSGALNDGNEDFAWKRGAVMTAKEDGLWDAWGEVTPEDVRHMQSRHIVFRASASLPNMRGVAECAPHMCAWIKTFSDAFDARQVVRPFLGERTVPSPAASSAGPHQELLAGMENLRLQANLGAAGAVALSEELRALGAVHVQEVTTDDWERLNAWQTLPPFEQRRLLSIIRG